MMRLAKKLLTAALSFGVVLMIPFSAHAEEAEANPNARTVPHYTYSGEAGETGEGEKGDIWDGEHYYLADGTLVKDAFFCDGEHTFYLQYDGTPMINRLTYHPDGEHIIYFDEYGWETFDDFALVEKSIEGDFVGDLCFFDSNGYMYIDCLTWGPSDSHFRIEHLESHTTTILGETYDYSQTLFYITPYGKVQCEGIFQYEDGTYGFCDGYSVVPYGIRTSLFYCVMNEDGTKDFVSRKLEYPVYIGFDGRCDFEKSKQYEKCDGNQISLINATLTYKWQEPKLQYEIFITPNGYDLIRYKLRVYNHAVSEGKSEDEAWDEAQNKWSEEINKIEDGEFYLLRGSKEDFDSFMVSVYGDWILDPYWEYGLLD